jgi:hypothetical protein
LKQLFGKLDQGVEYFKNQQEEAVEYISTQLDYSQEDAREWLKTVTFADKTGVVDAAIIEKTVIILKKAGVLSKGVTDAGFMIRVP